MKQKNRFAFFFFGILIGVVCVYFIFGGGSDSSWLPNDRILGRLQSSLIVDENAQCFFNCHKFSPANLDELWKSGDVELGNHKIEDGEVYTYFVNGTNTDGETVRFEFEFQWRMEQSHLRNATRENMPACDCAY